METKNTEVQRFILEQAQLQNIPKLYKNGVCILHTLFFTIYSPLTPITAYAILLAEQMFFIGGEQHATAHSTRGLQ